MPPSVSVIIPVYNRSEFLKRAVESVLAQSFKDYELVVVDDGSIEDLSDARRLIEAKGHRLLRLSRSGVSAARNTGVFETSAPWIAFLDSDDLWLERKLEAQVRFLTSNPEIRICQTEERWIRKGRFVNPRKYHKKPRGRAFEASLGLCCISPSAVILERSLFLEHGGFDERMVVCEDYDLWLRITARHEVGLIDEPLIEKYGGHADQLSCSVVGIDRFRVFALVKLYLNGELDLGQELLLLRELARKAAILSSGAMKRGNDKWVLLFGRVYELAVQALEYTEPSRPRIRRDFTDIFVRLEENILER